MSQKVYRNRLTAHTRDATFRTISAPEQDYFAPFLKDLIPAVQQRALVPVHNVPDQFLSFTIGYSVNIV